MVTNGGNISIVVEKEACVAIPSLIKPSDNER